MALPNPSAGDSILAAHIDSIRTHLQGASGDTEAWAFRQSSGNVVFTLATADGSNGFRINDSAGTQVGYLDSDGNLTIAGGLTQATQVFPLSASPAQTAEGSVVWDSDDDVLTIGDGASRKTFYPGQQALQERWLPHCGPVNTTALSALTANAAYLIPMEPLTRNRTLATITVNLGGSTDNIDVGVYSTTDDATFTKVVTLGSTAFPGTGDLAQNIADTALTAGTKYYIGIATAGTTATFGSITSAVPWAMNSFTKASSFPLPTSITAVSATTNPTPLAYGTFA